MLPPPPATRCPGVPSSWPYPSVPLGRLLTDAVADFPDAPALRLPGSASLTHVEFAQVVERVVLALRARGATRVVPVGCRTTTQLILAHAAFRAGCCLVLGVDATSSRPVADQVPLFDPACDVVVGSPRALRQVHAPPASAVHDDLDDRLLATHRRRRAATMARSVRRVTRLSARNDQGSLAAMVEAPTQGVIPAVAPGAVAVVVLDPDPDDEAHGSWRVFTHAALLAATFQLRLWIPDMQAGSERVAAVQLGTVTGIVTGPLLAVLTGAELVVATRPGDALRAATIACADVPTWRTVAASPARGRPTAGDLRVGIMLARRPDDQLDAQDVRRVIGLTDGARLRHAWVTPAAAGPVTAQPVYGRIGAMPGARRLPDVELASGGGRLQARGPQFTDPGAWHDVHDHVAGSPSDQDSAGAVPEAMP